MVIAVDMRFAREGYGSFIHPIFSILSKQFPANKFIFISENPGDISLIYPENVLEVVIAKSKVSFLSQIVTDKKISSLLKKYKADVFVTANCLLNTNVSQCLIFNKNLTAKNIKRAKIIVANSKISKQNIINRYNIKEEKISVIYPGVDEIFQPVNLEEREKIKEKYAEGKEYFLINEKNNSETDLLNLLKAFSIFKKRQKSSMQLLIATENKLSAEFTEQLRLYKFKNDVKILEGITKDESAKFTAASYAMIFFPCSKEFNIFPLEALKCNVPLIISDTEELHEIFGNAALYVNAEDFKNIAEKMMLIFKDENLRNRVIEKGKEQIKKYSWNMAAEQLWSIIEMVS